RSVKCSWLFRLGPLGSRKWQRDRVALCIDRESRADPLQPRDDDPVLRRDATSNHAKTVDERPDLDGPILRLGFSTKHAHGLLGLVTPDRFVGKQGRTILTATR